MSKRNVYVVYCPAVYDLMSINRRNLQSIVELVEYLAGQKFSSDKVSILKMLNFRRELRKQNEGLELDTLGQYYIAQQIAIADPVARVILADNRRRPLAQVLEQEEVAAVFITTMSAGFPVAIVATILLNHLCIPVIIGGVHVSTSPQDFPHFTKDIPFPEIVAQVINAGDKSVISQIIVDLREKRLKKEYHGRVWVENGVWGNEKLENLPHPHMGTLSRYPIVGSWVRDKMPIAQVAPHVGCPHACSFCSNCGISNRTFYSRNNDDLVEELRWWQQKGYRAFFFTPDNLLLDRDDLLGKLEAIIASELKINFAAQVSIDVADDEYLLKTLRQAGATHFFIGFESLDLDNLRYIRKACVRQIELSGLSVLDYYAGKIRKIHKHGIGVHGAFIMGLPNDYFRSKNSHSGVKIANFCRKNHIGLQATPLTDLPGSKQYKKSLREGTNFFGQPQTLDYLVGLCLTDITESNRLPPDSLHKSPLVVSYMAWHALMLTDSVTNTLHTGLYTARRSFLSPIRRTKSLLMDRFLLDPFMSLGAQIVVSQLGEVAENIVRSTNGRMGSFRRLFATETNEFVREELEFLANM